MAVAQGWDWRDLRATDQGSTGLTLRGGRRVPITRLGLRQLRIQDLEGRLNAGGSEDPKDLAGLNRATAHERDLLSASTNERLI